MEPLNVIAIAALGKDTRYICSGPNLLWHLSEDLKHVKKLTTGKPIIMGRKTYESIGRPLPNRLNVILTRDESYRVDSPDVAVVHDIIEALKTADAWCREHDVPDIYIFGGAEIYELALPYTTQLELTLVDSLKSGDRQFPEYANFFMETAIGQEQFDVPEDVAFKWVSFKRKQPAKSYLNNHSSFPSYV